MIINKFKTKLKYKTNQFLFDINYPFSKIRKNNNNLIFMYHGISIDKKNIFNSRHTFIKDFEKQISYLSKKTNIITVKDFFQEKFDKKKINVSITFDDGYLNNLNLALPILEKYNVQASIYSTCLFKEEHQYIWADFLQISSKYGNEKIKIEGEDYIKKNFQYVRVKDRKPLIDIIKNENVDYNFKKEIYSKLMDTFSRIKKKNESYWKLMNHNDLQQISKSKLITIGTHGYFHNNLGNLNLPESINEVKYSKSTLESIIQKEINEIAYPDGSFNEALIIEAKKIGLNYQLGTECNEIDNYINNPTIKGRKGIYQCSSWGNQLI
jgi:peptidoglycan/xylan/chitin deacetylase (PgdA/CDA1 family)